MAAHYFYVEEGRTMITSRKEAKALIARYEIVFAPILNKPCTLRWDKFDFIVTPTSIEIAKTTGRKNIPDKRENGEKNSTPMLFVINTDSGELLFALDDVQVATLGPDGVRLIVPLDEAVGEAHNIELDLRVIQ